MIIDRTMTLNDNNDIVKKDNVLFIYTYSLGEIICFSFHSHISLYRRKKICINVGGVHCANL